MAKLNDITVVDGLMESVKDMTQDRAWKIVNDLIEREKAEKEPPAKKQRTEWLVVVADPSGRVPKDLMGFVVNKKVILKDEKMDSIEEPRMWGDEEASLIIKQAFARTASEVKGIPTFTNCLRAAKKLLKEEYGFDIKSKEGCYIAPIGYVVEDQDDDELI